MHDVLGDMCLIQWCCAPDMRVIEHDLLPCLAGGRSAKLRGWARRLVSTSLVLAVCLGVACAVPGQSGTVLTFTGATFVCLGKAG